MRLKQYIVQQNEQQMFGVACVGDDFWCSSACLELDEFAEIISYEEYHPFGTTSYRSGRTETEVSLKRYKYVGKELDAETGLYYYGARYYTPEKGIWLSVDQKSDDYPHQSPYMFCSGNPVMRVDMNGMNDGWVEDPSNPNKGVYWDPSVNNKEQADAKGLDYKGQTVYATNSNGEFKYGDANGQWQNAAPIDGPTATATRTSRNNLSSSPWMDYALKEVGVKEYSNGSNPRIETYLKSAGLNNAKDDTYWCGAFVNWSLSEAGIKGAGAKGNNYLSWGVSLDKPKYGAVTIFKTGHVGFYMDTNKDGTLKILHGNWSNQVKISSGKYDPIYPNQIKGYRFPK